VAVPLYCQIDCGGVEENCSVKSQGGEDDSTGLRTRPATITPRMRCVPPGALKRRDGEMKSAEMGSRQAPHFGFRPAAFHCRVWFSVVLCVLRDERL
jgi:hypothetical protein